MDNYLALAESLLYKINLTSGQKVACIHLRCSYACSGQNFTKLNAQTRLKLYLQLYAGDATYLCLMGRTYVRPSSVSHRSLSLTKILISLLCQSCLLLETQVHKTWRSVKVES